MEKQVLGRLIKKVLKVSVGVVGAGLLCPCAELVELLPECLGAEPS